MYYGTATQIDEHRLLIARYSGDDAQTIFATYLVDNALPSADRLVPLYLHTSNVDMRAMMRATLIANISEGALVYHGWKRCWGIVSNVDDDNNEVGIRWFVAPNTQEYIVHSKLMIATLSAVIRPRFDYDAHDLIAKLPQHDVIRIMTPEFCQRLNCTLIFRAD